MSYKEIEQFLAHSRKISDWLNKHYATGGKSSEEVVIDQLSTVISTPDSDNFVRDILFVVNAEILMGGNSLIYGYFEKKSTISFLKGLNSSQLGRLISQVNQIASFIVKQMSADLGTAECEMTKRFFNLFEERLNTYRRWQTTYSK